MTFSVLFVCRFIAIYSFLPFLTIFQQQEGQTPVPYWTLKPFRTVFHEGGRTNFYLRRWRAPPSLVFSYKNFVYRKINSLTDVMMENFLTLRATFLSLFIALNCFILVKTAISRGLSEASPSSFIHGWSAYYNIWISVVRHHRKEKYPCLFKAYIFIAFIKVQLNYYSFIFQLHLLGLCGYFLEDGNLLRASMADNRSLGSECKSFLIRSLAPLDMEGQGSDEKSICPRRTASKIPWSFSVNESNQIFLRIWNPGSMGSTIDIMQKNIGTS